VTHETIIEALDRLAKSYAYLRTKPRLFAQFADIGAVAEKLFDIADQLDRRQEVIA